jgi:hypothetical protein
MIDAPSREALRDLGPRAQPRTARERHPAERRRGSLYKDRAHVIRPARFFKHDPVKRGQETSTAGRREVVSGRLSHKERRTPRTSSVSISFTGRLRMVAAYYTSVIFHGRRCISLRHSVDLPPITSSASCPNIGTPLEAAFSALRRTMGSPPLCSKASPPRSRRRWCGGPMAIVPHRHWLTRVLNRRCGGVNHETGDGNRNSLLWPCC